MSRINLYHQATMSQPRHPLPTETDSDQTMSTSPSASGDVDGSKSQASDRVDAHSQTADAAAALKWGINPSKSQYQTTKDVKISDLPEDHPIHQYSKSEITKIRESGISPILKAEMDQGKKGKGFWGKVGQTAMGGGWIK